MAGELLASIMLDAARNGIPESERSGIVFGSVTSVSPLKIQVRNEPKLILTEEFLKLSPLCIEQKLKMQEKNTEDTLDHTHKVKEYEIVLWRGLEVGDDVLMLRVKHGNLFYVLQREGELNVT